MGDVQGLGELGKAAKPAGLPIAAVAGVAYAANTIAPVANSLKTKLGRVLRLKP